MRWAMNERIRDGLERMCKSEYRTSRSSRTRQAEWTDRSERLNVPIDMSLARLKEFSAYAKERREGEKGGKRGGTRVGIRFSLDIPG